MNVVHLVEEALYERLADGVSYPAYRRLAPPNGTFPCVIYARQSGIPEFTQSELAGWTLVYQVKFVGRGYSNGALAHQADELLWGLLQDNPLSIEGDDWRNVYLRRVSDVEYDELTEEGVYQHLGGLYQIEVVPA